MRQTKHLLLAVLFVLPLFFVACSDDDDDNGNGLSNHFTYDGETYALDLGFIMNYGQWWGDGYNFDIFLHSDGIEISDNFMDVTGEGHGIYFEMFSPNEDDLTPGTYNWDGSDEGNPFTYTWGDIIMDWDFETDEGTEITFSGGNVEVEKSGSNYTIRVAVTAEDGKEITAYFRGPLPIYDIEDFWKSDEKVRLF